MAVEAAASRTVRRSADNPQDTHPAITGVICVQSALIRTFFKEDRTMLVLSRKQGEGIVIGDDVTVTVVGIQGGRVKLGFVCAGGSTNPP